MSKGNHLKTFIINLPLTVRRTDRAPFILRTMYKGTTPTYTFTSNDVDLTIASKVFVTFSTMDEKEIMTKSDDLVITSHSVEVYLNQEETLSLPTGSIKVQINWLYDDNGETKRACSNKMTIPTKKNLKNEVLNG